MHVRYGAMGSQKTARLVMEAYNYTSQGDNIIVAKPAIDTKAAESLSSRVGLELPVDILVGREDSVTERLAPVLGQKRIECMFVDEGQFLEPSQVNELYWDVSADFNIPVIVYMLRADFQAIPFPGSERLLALADEAVELPINCQCGDAECNKKKARFNTRVIDGQYVFEGEQVAIHGEGGVDYRALSKECYRRERLAYEQARRILEVPLESFDRVYAP